MDTRLERAPGSGGPAGTAGAEEVRIRFWGTRGSIPSPGPTTARYGGNTSCVELFWGPGRRIIFDAGSGLRALGHALGGEQRALDGIIFLTHFHWDHIQGFPFFVPLYDRSTRLRIVGPRQEIEDAQTLFAGQMGPVYFPIPYSALSATLEFHHLNEGVWEGEGYRVRALRVRHPSFTVGYRVEVGGRVIIYAPDNELVGGEYGVAEDWAERFDDFVRGSDVLIHDCMYTEDEYEARHGWGHSTYDQTLALALRTGVRMLVLFHHSPERTDLELSARLLELRQRARMQGSGLAIEAAAEGAELVLPASSLRP